MKEFNMTEEWLREKLDGCDDNGVLAAGGLATPTNKADAIKRLDEVIVLADVLNAQIDTIGATAKLTQTPANAIVL